MRVGHWTDPVARTGCTVVLFPAGTVASGEIRGGAPGTREWAVLEPGRTVQHIDAVVLAGGSAFGLAACDGVMRWCEERGIGFPTRGGVVPIVIGAVIFDLGVGDASVRPGPDEGYAACVAATTNPVTTGRVGAGTGATVGGAAPRPPGGVGTSVARRGDLVVAALVVVNAFGRVRAVDGDTDEEDEIAGRPLTNTTIGVVATNATIDKVGCRAVAEGGQDGLVRALQPPHASFDGDAMVAAATGQVSAPVDLVRLLAVRVTESAVRDAVA